MFIVRSELGHGDSERLIVPSRQRCRSCRPQKCKSYMVANMCKHSRYNQPNVLISPTLEPLLADFGVSHILTASMSQMCGTSMAALKGTVRWMAVELLTTEAIPNEKSDVWAFGMVLYVRYFVFIRRNFGTSTIRN